MRILDDDLDLCEERVMPELEPPEHVRGVVTLLDHTDSFRGQAVRLQGQEPAGCFDGVCECGEAQVE